MGRHAAAPVKVPWNLTQMRPLQQVRRRGRRRAQSGLFRGHPAHPSTMLSAVSGTAATHLQAGAAGPRAGLETTVRLTAYTRTRVNPNAPECPQTVGLSALQKGCANPLLRSVPSQ